MTALLNKKPPYNKQGTSNHIHTRYRHSPTVIKVVAKPAASVDISGFVFHNPKCDWTNANSLNFATQKVVAAFWYEIKYKPKRITITGLRY